jgi:hypothetical protein
MRFFCSLSVVWSAESSLVTTASLASRVDRVFCVDPSSARSWAREVGELVSWGAGELLPRSVPGRAKREERLGEGEGWSGTVGSASGGACFLAAAVRSASLVSVSRQLSSI